MNKRAIILLFMLLVAFIVCNYSLVFAQDDLSEFTNANIYWRQFEGQTIKVMFTAHPWQEQLVPLFKQFEELTGMKVTFGPLYPTMEYRQKRAMEYLAGTWDWDVYMLCPIGFGPEYASKGWAEPLDQFINNEKITDPEWYDYEDFFTAARDFTVSDGKSHFEIPITAEAQVLFYRTDLFQENGLNVPATMDELYTNAVKLTQAPRMFGITLRGRIDSNWWPLHGFLSSYGGGWFDKDWNPIINSPESVAGIEMYGKLCKDAGSPGIPDNCFDEIGNEISTGRAAMFLDASVAYPRFSDKEKSVVSGKIGTGIMPAGPAGSKPNVHFWGLSMNSGSQKKDAAWLFIQWATSKPIQKKLAINGIASPRASAWEDPEFIKLNPEDFIKGVSESLSIGSHGPLHVKFSDFQHVLTIELQNVITNTKTAQEAADEVAKEWKKALKQ